LAGGRAGNRRLAGISLVEHRNRATGQPRARIIRPAGENDRNLRSQHDTCRVGTRQVAQFLRQHVAGLHVGYEQNISIARHAESMCFTIADS
jgi:hypothetical protein